MGNKIDRRFTILADGEPVTGYARARLLGTERMGLYATFRDFIRKKLIQWSWDGRNVTVSDVVARIQPGARQTDNMNGTVTITGAGSQPATVKDLFPITAGVRQI